VTLPFSVHNSAELELNEAADFYDIENPGLGRALIDEFEGAVATIREHPETAPIVLGNVRRWRMLRFPYFVVYSVRKARTAYPRGSASETSAILLARPSLRWG
jgi:hypothetical protein